MPERLRLANYEINRSKSILRIAVIGLEPKKVRFVPQFRHPTGAQRTTGLDFGQFGRFQRPLSGNRAALPRIVPQSVGRRVAKFAATASGGFVRKL